MAWGCVWACSAYRDSTAKADQCSALIEQPLQPAALQTNQTQSQNREYEDKVSTLVKSQPCTEENLANILEMVQ